ATAAGVALTRMARADLLSIAPGLGPEVAGGLWSESESTVDPGELLDALRRALRVLGATVVRERVSTVLSRSGSVIGVETDDGTVFPADRVVACVGASQSYLRGGSCQQSECSCSRSLVTPVRGMTIELLADPPLSQRTPVL